ncbi:LysR family transcriptional regulator [Alsobacter soli]|uniref:LysR family transcriptional regulator n=1 Tax=Alsobacter soli TaxID=2109933 RepID=A0A2T1HWJ8_9HYPH|nr:LysR family transcriptional regulator [Alsobacter soli]PSC06066.1 LysR family transcriptional regulator [Alsobacter soli]
MEMHQIRYFLALCEDLNFTRAAERCHVAQPSLTRAVKLLEDELGGPLFHRERANTHLSELGRMVRPHLEEVYERAQQAKREALDFSKLKRTTLRIGIMCTIAPYQLVDLLTAVQVRHPGVELHIVDAAAPQLEERLVQGDLEVAIYCRPQVGDDDRLHRMALFREQMMIVVAPTHRFAGHNVVRAQDLDGERYVNRANCEFTGIAGPIWKDHGATCSLVYRSERDDWVLAMVAAGLGFGFMPESCVTHPGVVARPLIDPEFWREVNLVTVRGRPHSPAVGAFVREAMRARWPGQARRSEPGLEPDAA